jgi:CBS domain-containing protein
MRVFEVMSEQVAAVAPEASAAEARQLMKTKGINHLVVMRNGVLEGILSARDLAEADPRGRKGGRPVSDLMHAAVVTIGPKALVSKAANVMAGRSIGSLIVTDRGRVVGIITISDLLALVSQGAGRQPKRVARATLKNKVPHRKQHGAGGAW